MTRPPDLTDPVDRVGYLLWQTAHLVGREMANALEPFDLTPAQFGLLVHTGREPGVSGAELARRVNLTPQSIQTALRPLLERQWMQRRPHTVHRRILGNFLTPVGVEGAERASAAVSGADAKLSAGMSDAETAQFKALLRSALLSLNPTALDRSSLRSRT
jgi:DNA-binding MarR family transcriptional regulator